MTCLTDARVQAVADGEGSADENAHAASCARCEELVKARTHAMAVLEGALADAAQMPPGVARRVETSLRSGGGATRLRPQEARPFVRRAAWSGVALAAATIALVLFVPSLLKDRGALTASEILAESAERLTASGATGVEILEYELVVEGIPAGMAPDGAGGSYRIWKAIDHADARRYRFATYSPDGRLLSSIAQDPSRGSRTIFLMVDGQPFRFEFGLTPEAALSLPEIEQLHMQASVSLMEASGNQLLEVVDTPSGRQYRIEVPEISAPSENPLWDLTQARVAIDERDYRIVEFAVKGTFLRQPYGVSYKLNTREIVDAAPPGLFEIPAQAGEMVLEGEATMAPPRDAFVVALKELARARQAGR